MKLIIRTGDLNDTQGIDELMKTVKSRMTGIEGLEISLSQIEKVNLSTFNRLIKFYMHMTRHFVNVIFCDCDNERLISLAKKTKFDHVFAI